MIRQSALEEEFGFESDYPEPSTRPVWGGVGDIAQGAAYGASEAVRGVYGMVDALDNIFFDILPKWGDPVVDAPESGVGALVGSLTQFFIPYMGFTKLLSVQNAARRGLGFGKFALPGTKRVVNFLDGNQASSMVRAYNKGVLQGGTRLGWTKVMSTAAVGNLGREAVKGGIVDAMVFQGNEQRLSAGLSQFGGALGKIGEFFEVDPDDSEWEGRFKNVLEGMALGGIFDATVDFWRAKKAYTASKRVGMAPYTNEKGVVGEIPDDVMEQIEFDARLSAMNAFDASKESARIQQALEDDIRIKAEKDVEYNTIDENGEAVTIKGSEMDQAVEDFVEENFQGLGEMNEILEQTEKEAYSNYSPRLPRNAERRKADNLSTSDRSFAYFFGNEGFSVRMKRAIERKVEDINALTADDLTKDADIRDHAIAQLSDQGGISLDEAKEILMDVGQDGKKMLALGYKAFLWRTYSDRLAQEIQPMVQAYKGKGLSQEELTHLYHAFEVFTDANKTANEIFSGAGRILNIARIGMSSEDVAKIPLKNARYTPKDELEQMVSNPEAVDMARVQEILDELDTITKSENGLDNLKAVEAYMGSTKLQRGFAQIQEAHINGLLSGISTQLVNMSGAVMMTFLRPLEQSMGVMIEKALTKKGTEAYEQAVRLQMEESRGFRALFTEFKTAWAAMSQTGTNPYETLSMLEKRPISPLQLSYGNKGGMYDSLVKGIRLPSTYLEKMDSFMKLWNGRARARGIIEQRLLESGEVALQDIPAKAEEYLNKIQTSKGDIADQVKMAKSLGEKGVSPEDQAAFLGEAVDDPMGFLKMSDEEIEMLVEAKAQGVIAGQEATFTHKMRDGMFGAAGNAMQQFTRKAPVMKFLLPFVRTPVNIADYGWDHTFGAILGTGVESLKMVGRKLGMELPNTQDSLFRLQRELASEDAMVRARARGRMAMGVGVGTSIAVFAQMFDEETGLPQITGSGPSDPDARKSLTEAGWQPFSIRLGGKYYSYGRMDPVGSILGFIVDASEYIRENADSDPRVSELAQAVFMASIASVSNNITSKTYLKGLQDVIQALDDPDARIERFVGGVAASFVPTILASTERAIDPDLQEVRSVLDRVQSRIPGLSSRLPVRRNLLGEPVTTDMAALSMVAPVRVTKVKDDLVRQELARFAYGFSMPSTERAGVDLLDEELDIRGQAAYDRFTELVGEVKIGSKTLRQELRRTFKSAEYQALSPDDGEDGDLSPRILTIQSILRQYREKAWGQLRKEQPKIQRAMRERQKRVQARRQGKLTL